MDAYRFWSVSYGHVEVLLYIHMAFIFEKGDMVKFIDEAKVRLDYFHHVEYIYQIASIEESKVIIFRDFSIDISTDLSAITAVKIDGKEDRSIYYNPVIAASCIRSGEPLPSYSRDYTYYLDANVSFSDSKTMGEFVKENGFLHVHELLHYLRDHYQKDDVEINV